MKYPLGETPLSSTGAPAGTTYRTFNAMSERGQITHEQVDDTPLTHMNGRVHDYRLGRFLGVASTISIPASGHSVNPYYSIGDNPLSGVDPTGYEAEAIGGSADLMVPLTQTACALSILARSGARARR